VIPVVMPLTDVTWQSEPGVYHSRVTLDGDMMALYRQTGNGSRRMSGTAGWNLPYITDDGEVIQFNASLRSDVYNVSDVQLTGGRTFGGTVGREIPQASVLWRYPFIDRWGTSSLMLEPIVEADATTGGGNPETIPNEDSLVPEFNDSNLFSPNRFAGFDRVENGEGMSYGLHGQAQIYSDKYIDWLLGQHYRIAGDTQFPFANDLNNRFSDYVGKVSATYMPFTLAYRFRFDHETLAATRSEIDAGFNEYPFSFTTSYLSLRNDPVLASKETVSGSGVLNLDKEWSWNVTGSRDLLQQQTDTFSTGLAFKNECVNLTAMVGKNYTFLEDIKPALTFWFTLSLKNLE
jgi:LPS-assembly protein